MSPLVSQLTPTLKNCVDNLERMCNTTFKQANVPMNPLYHPETDTTKLCSPSEHSKYRSLIGSANWMITLGRFDINYAVNTLAQYCVAPQTTSTRYATH